MLSNPTIIRLTAAIRHSHRLHTPTTHLLRHAHAHSTKHNPKHTPHPEDVDENGVPYNEMDALPFNQQPGVKEPVDWKRRIFLGGYVGGIMVFLFLLYYKPDTTMETWALGVAQERMRERGVDFFWYDPKQYRRLVE